MSAISNLIFKGASHYVTSPFGKRTVIKTSAGTTSTYHNGTDYGTNNKNIAQYAIEDGYCFASTKAADGANYVWIIYPRIKLAMLHYHLDSRKISAGAKVKKNTLIGYTGKTGKATGIHLHLGIRDLAKLTDSQVNKITYSLLSSCAYVDPEKVKYTEAAATPIKSTATTSTKTSFLPSRGYFKKGDISASVGKLSAFMRKTFPAYTSEDALGNTYGDNLIKSIKQFQKNTGLVVDGYTGAKTLAMLKKYGFAE